jgi:hypothetical protein
LSTPFGFQFSRPNLFEARLVDLFIENLQEVLQILDEFKDTAEETEPVSC